MRERRQQSGIRLRSDGIEIQGIRVPLHSAGFPYWELAPSRWESALEAAAELRLRLLRLDIPWVLHELSPGVWDWGERRSELDLPRLLKLAHARGLFVLARPGPWLGRCFPEGGGLPPRLLASREVRALDTFGTRRPVPSPVSEVLAAEAERWLEAVSECLSPYVYPQGPIVAWISGGVGPLPSLWGGGALDRSKDALAFFARFVEVKYPSTRAPIGFPPSLGPLRVEDLEHCIAWVEAGELAERSLITRLGPPLPSEPETAAGQRTKLPVLAAVDDPAGAAGADAFATSPNAEAVSLIFPEDAAREFSALRLLGLRAGELGPSAGVLEIPAGGSLLRPRPALDATSAAAVLAMSGVRALDLDTLLPRGQLAEVDAPLDHEGRARLRSSSRWQDLFRLLDAIDHAACWRRSDCLLLANRELARLREACTVAGRLPAELGHLRATDTLRVRPRELGLRDRPEQDHDNVFHALFDGLRRSGIAFSVADTSLPVERLARWRVILLTGFEHISRALAQRIFGWVAEGGTLVLGPRLPTHDWAGAPLGLRIADTVKARLPRVRMGKLVLEDVDLMAGVEPVLEADEGTLASVVPFQAGRIVHFGFRFPWQSEQCDAEALVEIVRKLLAPAGIEPCYPASDPSVETELHGDEERRFLFIANPGASARRISLETDRFEGLREVRGGGRHVRAGEPLIVPPQSVLLREIVRL